MKEFHCIGAVLTCLSSEVFWRSRIHVDEERFRKTQTMKLGIKWVLFNFWNISSGRLLTCILLDISTLKSAEVLGADSQNKRMAV